MHVYKITTTKSNKVYIGVTTTSLNERWNGHKQDWKYKKPRKLYKAFTKHGIGTFTIETLATVTSHEELLRLEKFYVKQYDSFHNGYNMNEGGTGLLFHTEDSKQKMSDNNRWKGSSRTGESNPMFGRKHTEESLEKMRVAKVGKRGPRTGAVLTDAIKAKISASRTGQQSPRKGTKISNESRLRMSEAQKNTVRKYKKQYLVTFPDGKQEVVINMAKFCREHNLNHGNVSAVINGKYNNTKGFVVERIDD